MDDINLRDLVAGETVGIEINTYLYKTYTLAKVAKITPTGIIRLVSIATPNKSGMTKYSFRMDNTAIRDKRNYYTSSTEKIVSYDFAMAQIEAEKVSQQKKAYAVKLANDLKQYCDKIPLQLLEVINMKLIPYIK